MEKIIIVTYLDVRGLSVEEFEELFKSASKALTTQEDSIISFIVPVRRETTVECINPRLVSEEDYIEAKNTLERYKIAVNDFYKISNEESN